MDLNASRQLLAKLTDFSTRQSALSAELLEARPLGICKTSTFGNLKLGFRNLDLTNVSGHTIIKIDTTHSKRDTKSLYQKGEP